MSEMIERVARAIDATGKVGTSLAFTEAKDGDTTTIRFLRKHDTERAVAIARIAIEAMRDPTAYMLDVADAIEPRDRVVLIWRVMIDKALE